MCGSVVDSEYNLMQLDTDEVTVENSMSKSFDQIIKLQLDPVWNQLVSVAYIVNITDWHICTLLH